ncbi:MAG: 16S rRNA (cytidine(1402)-2'-O)-methyltransferase [Deltaproteobacteria bacterium]|nr:16S rRNA (cytidine(1402)-2'-O)-methyltransferase [Deltaproteobacteria bacterium]
MQNTANTPGKLFVVATPIGNLNDITLRAIDTLHNVDMIACEDTRTSLTLLNNYNIKKELISFHKFSTKEKAAELIAYLKRGRNIAFITDAGTPGISDPGAFLVRLAWENTIKVIPIPGPSAVASAVSISGICEQGFVFLGFMPAAVRQRNNLIKKYFMTGLPVVFYESPRRLINTLGALRQSIGNTRVFVFKELTKIYEEGMSGVIDDVVRKLKQGIVKGEYTVIVNTLESRQKDTVSLADRKSLLEAAALVTGMSKREVYKKLFTKR